MTSRVSSTGHGILTACDFTHLFHTGSCGDYWRRHQVPCWHAVAFSRSVIASLAGPVALGVLLSSSSVTVSFTYDTFSCLCHIEVGPLPAHVRILLHTGCPAVCSSLLQNSVVYSVCLFSSSGHWTVCWGEA